MYAAPKGATLLTNAGSINMSLLRSETFSRTQSHRCTYTFYANFSGN